MNKYRGGFALPTVLIASVVMLAVLVVSVSSVATVRTALKAQHYEQLAKLAGEAGAEYAKACLAQSGNVPLWTDAKPLTPATDCAGNLVLSPVLQVLVVGGGGGGGGNYGGGGGGGHVISDDTFLVSPQQYSITVGGGGAGAAAAGGAGANGGESRFASAGNTTVLTAYGGGGGGGRTATDTIAAGSSGNGGGGAGYGTAGAPSNGGSSPSGMDGGAGSGTSSGGNGGGGGGAAEPGESAQGVAVGEGVSGGGGGGQLSYISLEPFHFGAGGSGGRWGAGQVGFPGRSQGGIGGNATGIAGSDGAPNTGAGGGGGADGAAGGAGGSGVVVVRIPLVANIAVSGVTGTHTVTDKEGYRIYTFTAGTATFTVSSVSSGTCPTDPRCSVASEQNLRSSFKVGRPTLDADGKAVSIPNNGYVELLRTSNGAVWRTYRQPSVQAAAVPDFCSAATQGAMGWAPVVRTAAQDAIPGASATTISLADAPLLRGSVYYRKDISISNRFMLGNYEFKWYISSEDTVSEVYVNGTLNARQQGAGLKSADLALGAGECFSIMVRVTNTALVPQPVRFTASLGEMNAVPIVVSDPSWRVSASGPAHFATSGYNATLDGWEYAQGMLKGSSSPQNPQGSTAAQQVASWPSSDRFAQMLAGCPAADADNDGNCTANRWTYLRDSKDFYVPAETEVLITTACTKSCDIYMDGSVVLSGSSSSTLGIQQQTVTVPAGYHRLGARVYSGPSGPRAATGIAVLAARKSDNLTLARSDFTWSIARAQLSAADELYSYEKVPAAMPNPLPLTIDALAVGGGGGGGVNAGGGGGGGSVVLLEDFPVNVSTYAVSVGAGGAGATSNSQRGASGGDTGIAGAVTAFGGGGGASRDGGPAPATTGGGGAGTWGGGLGVRNVGANGYRLSQAWWSGLFWHSLFGARGGNGPSTDIGATAKGGGGGGAGGPGTAATSAVAGAGGPGYITYMNGTRVTVGAGGGGSVTASNGTAGAATDGASAGAIGAASNALANSGGGGGASGTTAPGGAGGSGIVIIRYKTADFIAARLVATGGSKVTVGEYTVHTFVNNGTFTVARTP